MSNPWNIEPVRQRKNGCFAAVVSMLTGIDYDVMTSVCPRFCTWFGSVTISTRSDDHEVWEVSKGVISAPWEDVKAHYMANYGVHLKWVRRQPDFPAGRATLGGGHIVVHLPDGSYIDPGRGKKHSGTEDPINYWLVATVERAA